MGNPGSKTRKRQSSGKPAENPSAEGTASESGARGARSENEAALAETLNEAQAIAGIGSFVWDLRTDHLEYSENMLALAGFDAKSFTGDMARAIRDLVHIEDRPTVESEIKQMIAQRRTWPMEFRVVRPDGSRRVWRSRSKFLFDEQGAPIRCVGVHYDITEQKQAEDERAVTVELLQLVNARGDLRELMCSATALLSRWSGCEAVGVRLRDGDDFPYYESSGLPPEFLLVNNDLCALDGGTNVPRDSQGNPETGCVCGDVLAGRFDPQLPCFTEAGSFWTNRTSQLALGPEGDRGPGCKRNRCTAAGYESIALIPLRAGEETFGLLQLNSAEAGKFSPDTIRTLERLVGNLATGLAQRRIADELRHSEETTRALIDAATDAAFLIDREGAMLALNDELARRFGLDKEDILGTCVYDLVPADVALRRKQKVDEVFRTGRPLRFEDRREDRILDHSVSPVFDTRGNVTRVAVFGRDVTDSRRARARLQAEKDRAQGYLDVAGVMLIALDRDGRVSMINRRGCEVLGYSEADIVGSDWFSRFLPADRRDDIREIFGQLMRGEVEPVEYVENVVLCADGEERTIAWRNAVIRDDHGTIIGTLSSGNDITEQKRSQEALRQQQEILANAEKLAQVGAWEYDALRDELVVSDGWVRIHGVADTRLEMEHLLPVAHPDDLPRIQQSFQAALTEGCPYDVCHRIINQQSGETRWVRAFGEPVRDDAGNIVRLLGACQDVTEQELAKASLREQRELLDYIVRHDPNAIAVYDNDLRYIYASERYKRDYRIGDRDITGLHHYEVFPEMPERWKAIHQRVLAGAIERCDDDQFVREDGSIDYNRWECRPWYQADGSIGGMITYTEVTTERKRAEQALRESEKRYRTLAENFPHGGLFLFDRDQRYLFCDGQGLAEVGLSREGLIGKTIWEVFPESMCEIIERNCSRVFQGESAFYEIEYQGRVYENRAVPVVGPDGEIREGLAITQEITERKRSEQAIRDRHAELHQIIEAIPDAIVYADTDRRIMKVNSGFVRLFGYQPEEVLGKPTRILYTSDEAFQQQGRARYNVGAKDMYEVYRIDYRKKNGEVFSSESVGTPVRDSEGRPIGFLSVVRDITQRLKAEEALREATEVQMEIVRASNVGLWDWDLRSDKVQYSLEWKKQVGCEDHEVGESLEEWRTRVHPDDLEPVMEEVRRSIAEDSGEHRTEFRFRHKDGSYRWIFSQASVVQDDSGRPVRMRGTHVDITDRKQAEEALRQSEAFLSAIYRNSDVVMFVVDVTESGEFVYAGTNPAHERMSGFRSEDTLGKTPDDLVNVLGSETVEYAKALYAQCARKGEAVESEHFVPEGPANGWWYTRLSPIVDETTGRVIRLIGSAMDFTELKEAQRALQASEEKFRSLIENANDIVYTMSPEGVFTYVSPNSYELLGYAPESIVGRAFDRYVHRDDRPDCRRYLDEVIRLQKQGADIQYRVRHRDGTWRWHLTRGAVLKDEQGRATAFLGIARDVTEREEARRQLLEAKLAAETANRAKTEFLANMSHEIRTPMTAVLGYADLLATPNLSQQDRREFLGLIQRNGKSLLAIINDILDLSKIESGRVELEMAETSPRQTVEEVVRLMHARAEEKGLRLSVDSPGDVPHKVRTDPTRLRQVLTNLVGNAVKYTDRGEVRVGLSSRPRSDGKTVLQLSVADTGIGIEAEKLQEVFDPFTQADTSHTRQYGGTGLGLAISQRLASMLGGEIQVQSTPGEGSVFTLTIAVDAVADTPRPKAPGTEQAEQTSAPEAAARRLEGRVLLVEDSPDLQGLMQVVLQGLGLHVDVASDGREACDMATQSKRDAATYDLILMDIQMPVMNGYEATRELRKRGWMGGIVALTAHALGRDRDACLAAGCDDYLPKPFTSEQLLNRLTRFLATARDD